MACTMKLDRLLMQRAIFDEVGNRAHIELMLFGKDFELGAACHRAVRIHDLHDDLPQAPARPCARSTPASV